MATVTFLRRGQPACKFLRNLSSTRPPRIIDSGLPNVDIPHTTIPEFVLPRLKYDHLVATECAVTGRKYTFGDIRKKSKNLGKNLRKRLGLQPGDVFAVLLPNVPEFSMVIMGALRAGLAVTTLNPLYTAEEMARQLVDSSAKAMITLNEFSSTASSINQLLKTPLPIISIRSKQADSPFALDFAEFTDTEIDLPEPAPVHPDSVAFLPYSSGTTGLPKGVQLTHRNIIANICQNNHPDYDFYEETTNSHQDVVSAVLPMFHIYGLTILSTIGLYKQVKTVTLPKFAPADYVKALKDYKPTTMFIVPPLALFLTASPDVLPEDLAPVRNIMCGAAPLGGEDEERFRQKAGQDVNILQGYGLTETSPVVTTTTKQMKLDYGNIGGTIGKPLPNTLLKVIDPEDGTGAPLGPNQTGELLIKGPQVMKGYHNRPEETSKTFLDGWLRTGDMVFYNEASFFFVTDRLKELIKVKGFQVAPAELEALIRGFPGVADAAVVGVPHAMHGEVPRAYIVAEKGRQVDAAGLERFVAAKVAEFKRLAGGVALVDAIPKNASGKTLRRALKEKYNQEGV